MPGRITRLAVPPAREAILAWNAPRPLSLDLRVHLLDGRCSAWLPYVRLAPWRSCSSRDSTVVIEVDRLLPTTSLIAVEVRSEGIVDRLSLATPPGESRDTEAAFGAIHLLHDPPALTQRIPGGEGWCNAASLAMLLGYWASLSDIYSGTVEVAAIAAEIDDPAYGGTGNWTFATAVAAHRGLCAVVAYCADLAILARLLAAQIPCAVAIAWRDGQLPGAPLPASTGHILVVVGLSGDGGVEVYDPALPDVIGRYPVTAFMACWREAGGVGYALSPPDSATLLYRILGASSINEYAP